MPPKLIRRVIYNWHIKIVSVALAVLLWIYVGGLKEKDRFITVPFEIRNITPGYTVSSDTPSFIKIVLRGTEGNLALVKEDEIKAYVEMDKGRRGRNRGAVRVEKLGIPPGVTIKEVSPRTVDLTVENLVTSSVEVAPVIVGKPQDGFFLADVRVSPSRVIIRGPSTSVKKVNSLHTESITIDGLAESVVKNSRVKIEDGKISLTDVSRVTVSILIEEEYVIRRYEGLQIEIRSLGSGLRALAVPPAALVTVKVPRRLEESLSVRSLHVYINGESVDRQGTYELPLLFMTDLEGATLVRLEPQRIDLIVETLKSVRK
jgi:YbbR domain-containing protein